MTPAEIRRRILMYPHDDELRHLVKIAGGLDRLRVLQLIKSIRRDRSTLRLAAQALEDLQAEIKQLKDTLAFLEAHHGRIQRYISEYDQEGRPCAWGWTVWNLEPRRSRVSFTDDFNTYSEAIQHLREQV